MGANDHTYQGQCLCGTVSFQVQGAANNVSNCHCRRCQKAAGAPYVTWAEFSEREVVWTGEAPRWFASTPEAERGYCPQCGSAVAFRYAESVNVDLAVALFDEATDLSPHCDIFTESAQAWVAFDPAIPQYRRNKP